jgi:hypothetical protein
LRLAATRDAAGATHRRAWPTGAGRARCPQHPSDEGAPNATHGDRAPLEVDRAEHPELGGGIARVVLDGVVCQGVRIDAVGVLHEQADVVDRSGAVDAGGV